MFLLRKQGTTLEQLTEWFTLYKYIWNEIMNKIKTNKKSDNIFTNSYEVN